VIVEVWLLLGLGQLALLAVVAAAVCGWRWRAAAERYRTLSAEADEARAALAAGAKLLAAAKPAESWPDTLAQRIKQLETSDDPTDKLRLGVFRYELHGDAIELTPAAVAQEDAELDVLRAELQALRAERENPAAVSPEREGELKSLVQQFTHDSREMLSCIQSLEVENKELRSQLAELGRSAA
jgi:hypothetical protein